MATDFKQYWYPDIPYAGESIAVAGCGPTSVSDLIDVSPVETAAWLQSNGWAVDYQGTIYEGIAACLTAFGADGRMLARDQDGQYDNDSFREWREGIQSGLMGVLLMHNVVSPYWTSGGHYIAVVEYRDGRYLVYDPASASRTGWHPFEHFAGNISALYLSSKRWKKDTFMFEVKPIRYGSTGNDVRLWQILLRGYKIKGADDKQLTIDGSFGNNVEFATKVFQEKKNLPITGVVDAATWKKALKR